MVTMLLLIGQRVPGINPLANGLGCFHSGHIIPSRVWIFQYSCFSNINWSIKLLILKRWFLQAFSRLLCMDVITLSYLLLKSSVMKKESIIKLVLINKKRACIERFNFLFILSSIDFRLFNRHIADINDRSHKLMDAGGL